jgi:hypothetical protein
MPALLLLFLLLRLAQQVVETVLARLNRRHALDPSRFGLVYGDAGAGPRRTSHTTVSRRALRTHAARVGMAMMTPRSGWLPAP